MFVMTCGSCEVFRGISRFLTGLRDLGTSRRYLFSLEFGRGGLLHIMFLVLVDPFRLPLDTDVLVVSMAGFYGSISTYSTAASASSRW